MSIHSLTRSVAIPGILCKLKRGGTAFLCGLLPDLCGLWKKQSNRRVCRELPPRRAEASQRRATWCVVEECNSVRGNPMAPTCGELMARRVVVRKIIVIERQLVPGVNVDRARAETQFGLRVRNLNSRVAKQLVNA